MANTSEDQGALSVSTTTETTSPSSTKYKGVRKRKWGKWVSEIRLPNSRERIWLGSYDSPEKAARAFDAAQFCLRGPSANFNFPDNPPQIAGSSSMSPAQIQAAAAHFANSDASLVSRPATAEEPEGEGEEVCYSPSMAQMECDVAGVVSSFYSHVGLAGGFGSGNFASEFGLFGGFDEYYSPPTINFDNDEDGGGMSGDSYLWNF